MSKESLINVSDILRDAGESFIVYRNLPTTKSFLLEASKELSINIDNLFSFDKKGDMWCHLFIAIHLAQWASAAIAMDVYRLIKEI